MSLKKKIILSFVISASIIAALAVFEYLNYIEMRREITYLELTDTVRSKSLQLRRHEKNFFLYGPQKGAGESGEVRRYINELNGILGENLRIDRTGRLQRFEGLLKDYSTRFDKIESDYNDLSGGLEKARASNSRYGQFFPLIEMTFLERPLEGSAFLEKVFQLPHDHPLTSGLRAMDSDIAALRKTGEDILAVSKDLDRTAREHVERAIFYSQVALLTSFPIFLLVGIGTLFMITGSVTSRLKMLIGVVEKTGKGNYPHVPARFKKASTDEVGVLIDRFNHMEQELSLRETELRMKNEELLISRKLAAIGTLASGVAHELNNPLNNIYLSAQVLSRETDAGCTGEVKQAVSDIVGQTARVKRIVGDLLEFARGREPRKERVDLVGLIKDVYGLVRTTSTYGTKDINFKLKTTAPEVAVNADPDQMERVFINLFTNAIDAMSGKGDLSVNVADGEGKVVVTVADTGAGINPSDLEKIFEPFYSTKERGTGLGLAIVFSIIQKHGGEVDVQSEKGRATAFTITLPKGKV